MAWLNIERESERLEAAYDRLQKTLGSDAQEVSTGLAERLQLRPDRDPRWTDQLSPLTLLYPLLQAEGLERVDTATARRANLGHLCLMIHTFVDDRHLDGQFAPTPDELLFSKSMLLEGLAILRRLPNAGPNFDRTVKRITRAYNLSQQSTTTLNEEAGDTLSDAFAKRIAAGRAAYGALAPLALAQSEEDGAARRIKSAFDELATALQWADDTEDWPADLETADENFLLLTLKLRGSDPYALPREPESIAQVGRHLVEHDLIHHAVRQTQRWLNRAVRSQTRLECPRLASLIQQNFRPLETAVERNTIRILTMAANH